MILLDPDRLSRDRIPELAGQMNQDNRVKAVLAGTSFLMCSDFSGFISALKAHLNKPLLIFPGNSTQLAPDADGLLLLSLISGRNPELLIGEHVRAAPHIIRMGLACVPTAYILIESGRTTAVEYVSNTKPIPADKPDILAAHVMAADLMGFKAVYLEAGSGAENPVPQSMIAEARKHTRLPLMVGGGMRSQTAVEKALDAGADYVVVGTLLEQEGSLSI